MIIKSIKLNNFRQYIGEQEVEFSCEDGKNMTIILGQNGEGKTTFVRAFAWCLYGGEPQEIGFKRNSSLLNENKLERLKKTESYKDVKETVSVELFISKDEVSESKDEDLEKKNKVSYIIRRSITYKNTPKGIVLHPSFTITKISGNENPKSITSSKEQKKIINSILPKDLSEYFFYWGEKIENIGNKEMSQAITDFLGLDVYQNTCSHLKRVEKHYRGKLIQQAPTDDIQLLEESLKKIQLSLKEIEEKLEKNKEDIEYFETKKTELNEQYYELKPTEERSQELKKWQTEVDTKEKKLNSKQDKFIKCFNERDSFWFYLLPQAKKALDLIKNNEKAAEGWKEISVKSIEEILRKNVCICGSDLSLHPELKQHLEQERQYAMPNALGGYVASFRSSVKKAEKDQEKYFQNLLEYYKDIMETRSEIAEYQERIDSLIKQVKGEKKAESLKKEIKNVENSLNLLNSKKDDLNHSKGAFLNEKKRLTTQIEKQLNSKKISQQLNKKWNIAKALAEKVKKEQESKEAGLKNELRDLTQKYFDEMYHGEKHVEIAKNFRAIMKTVVDGNKKDVETSAGTEAIKNFAFVIALITMAREMVADKKNSFGSEPYPLVLDAPFSQTDDEHIASICKLLSESAEEVILAMMEKDWNIAQSVLKDKVGFRYKMVKESETITRIEKVSD